MWTRHKQQQQCGAQLPGRERGRKEGAAPAEATRDRAAQEHDRADLDTGGAALQPGDYPASRIEHRDGDPSTGLRTGKPPTAPGDAQADWDAVVQPEPRRRGHWDGRPPPEGK